MNSNKKLNNRVAEESQLLLEQKWLIDALAKIKSQRNCLQIERLVLESLKLQGKIGTAGSSNKQTPPQKPAMEYVDFTSGFDYDEEFCNNEQLNLETDRNMFSRMATRTPFMEEDEEDLDNPDDVVIDVNMLMNGMQ